MGTVVNHQPYNGDKTTVRVALAKVLPWPLATFTLSAQAAKAATTIAVTPALPFPVLKGNWLRFVDPTTDLEYMAKVSADAAAGATNLSVVALNQAIPSAATCNFPSELLDRSNADLDRKYNTKDIYTLNTGGQRQVVSVSGAKSGKASGFWHDKNAGLNICEDAAEAKLPVYVFYEYEPPEGATKGEVKYGKAVITNLPKPSPAEGFIEGDVDFEFTGPFTSIPATY